MWHASVLPSSHSGLTQGEYQLSSVRLEVFVAQRALLGTGLLGSGMVRRLLKNGERVTVWNRSGEKARALEKDGATAAASPADAVRHADRIHVVLSDDRVVDALLEQIVPALKPNAIVIDH